MAKKQLYIVLGIFFTALGMIGVFVPLLPTTPFLLVAIWFFIRSSKKFLKWILRNKYLSPYVYGYISKKGMPRSVKIRTIILLWSTILISAFLINKNRHISILLLIIAIFVTIHILSIKTKKDETEK